MAADRDKARRPRFVRVKRPGKGPPAEEAAQRQPEWPAPGAEAPHEDADAHTRIVVPRQGRVLEAPPPEVDIELREVRYGAASKGPYLRIVPRQRMFTRVAPGELEATPLASRPRDIVGRYWADMKRVVIGSPFATSRAIHERLTKVKALAIFSSDALSSSAYATEEILIVLALAGSGALHNALPVSIVIALLLAIVVTSYQQTVRAYPSGGGAYTVAHENLGRNAGTVAASAIMVDYVLTVSVSVAAGVAAITSAAPDLHDLRVPIGVVMIGLMMLGNLRGVREAGTIFAIPTYVFIFSMGAVIAVGLVRVIAGDAPGSLLHGAPAREEVAATQGLTIFLLMRAFASGSTALTGVEAISNGVPSFKPPEVRNAQVTLAVMALVLGFLFLGVTFLTSRFGLAPTEHETIVSQLGREVLGKNALYYTYQVATALVLFLAANTGFAAFPMVASILARDRCVPRQFSFKGDRLAYSNGIVFLAAAASLLLVVFGGEVTRLIPLYAVGVFVSFTLSQSGMVRRWLRLREGAWKVSLTINAVGAVATGVVAVIIATTKFTHGAWISILMMMLLMALFTLIRRHYDRVEEELRVEEGALREGMPMAVAKERPPSREHVIVPVDAVNRISAAAVAFARELSARVTAVHVTDDREAAEKFRSRWQQAVPDVPLLLIESPYRAFVAPMLAYVESLERAEPQVRITVVLPGLVPRHWWERLLHNQDVRRLKPHLEKRPRVRVFDFPYRPGEDEVA